MNISLPFAKIDAVEKDWSEKHEIGAREHDAVLRGLEREVSFCEDAWRRYRTVQAADDLRWAKIARDKAVRCNSIRIIPDEDQ
jgi:hypothetical protein